MIFRLHIHADNAAFYIDGEDYEPRQELARLLHETAGRIINGEPIGHYQTIHDSNGNDVGRYALKDERLET